MAHECGKCSYMGEDVYRYCDDCHAAIEHPAAAAEITRLRAELDSAKQAIALCGRGCVHVFSALRPDSDAAREEE